jgi:threonine dehydrogenase-like Zn-dependent dehydrogenase
MPCFLFFLQCHRSDLHDYRGHHTKTYNFIMGHEACGKVVQPGNKINKFKVGDSVIVAFTTSCGRFTRDSLTL